ncbi:MAG: response regulator [Planctomycetota bacterium]
MTPPAPVATQAPRILVVDDEPQIRDILAATLRRDGFQVTSRGAPKEALRDLESGAFELLVTDLKMPEMSGLELIKAAKRVAPDIGSVLITAFASTETAVSALRNGADDYLMKPFGIDDLRRVVERVLAERRSESHGREALSVAREENESLRREHRETAATLQVVQRDLKLSRRDLERRVRDLELVAELTHLLTGQDVERIVAMTAQITARRFHAHVTRIEADVGNGMVEAEHREGVEPVALPLPLGALLAERARTDRSGVTRDEVLGQGRPLEGMAAVLRAAGEPAGSVVLLRPLLPSRDEQDLALLGMIASALTPALEAERNRRRAEANAVEVALGMLEAIESRGAVRRGHASRVCELATRAADRLGLSPRARRDVETAARLHDIGEVGVPDELLLRPGPLTPAEMDVVRTHAAVGARLLAPLGEAARLVRHHHERADGTGYPDGLVEDQIPVGAALIGVVEAYDAMTHARPYQRALTPTEARREILRLRGSQFVACAVDALAEVIPA